MNKTIAWDFDGVIAHRPPTKDGEKPEIGEPNKDVIAVINKLKSEGKRIIVFTCRQAGEILDWLEQNKVEYDEVNTNTEAPEGTNKGKVMADVYVDDKALTFSGENADDLYDKVIHFQSHEATKSVDEGNEMLELGLEDNAGISESAHAKNKCMECDRPPEVDVLWAEGKARAWFCKPCFEKWNKAHPDEVSDIHAVKGGEVTKEWKEGKSVSEKERAVLIGVKEDESRTFEESRLDERRKNIPDDPMNKSESLDFETAVEEAMQDEVILRFTYNSRHSGGTRTYFVEPYSWRNSTTKGGDNGPYLFAVDTHDDSTPIKCFIIDRVLEYHVGNDKFSPQWPVEISVPKEEFDEIRKAEEVKLLKKTGMSKKQAEEEVRARWGDEYEDAKAELDELIGKSESETTESVKEGSATSDLASILTKGRSMEKGITEKDVDPEQLKIGMEIEAEHTPDLTIRKKIAIDHLAEYPSNAPLQYYTGLVLMEGLIKKVLSLEKIEADRRIQAFKKLIEE